MEPKKHNQILSSVESVESIPESSSDKVIHPVIASYNSSVDQKQQQQQPPSKKQESAQQQHQPTGVKSTGPERQQQQKQSQSSSSSDNQNLINQKPTEPAAVPKAEQPLRLFKREGNRNRSQVIISEEGEQIECKKPYSQLIVEKVEPPSQEDKIRRAPKGKAKAKKDVSNSLMKVAVSLITGGLIFVATALASEKKRYGALAGLCTAGAVMLALKDSDDEQD